MDEIEKEILDCKASDNEYLHKDFHGALCYAIKYLDETYGADAVRDYLRQVGKTYFAPLAEALRKKGLCALEEHWRNIFGKEGGDFCLSYEDGMLILTVNQCPAIIHLKKINQMHTDSFCETTVVINETICGQAGYGCSCEYNASEGRCIQKFYKIKE